MYLLSMNLPGLSTIVAPVGARCRSSLHTEWRGASRCCTKSTPGKKSLLGNSNDLSWNVFLCLKLFFFFLSLFGLTLKILLLCPCVSSLQRNAFILSHRWFPFLFLTPKVVASLRFILFLFLFWVAFWLVFSTKVMLILATNILTCLVFSIIFPFLLIEIKYIHVPRTIFDCSISWEWMSPLQPLHVEL